MAGSLTDIVSRMSSLRTEEAWLNKACATMLAGSPISWHLAYIQSQLGTKLR